VQAFLSVPELLRANVRSHGDLQLLQESAARAVVQEGITDEVRVGLNIILGYAYAKTAQYVVAAHHYMSAFNISHAAGMDVQLVMTAGTGLVQTLIRQHEYRRARSTIDLLAAAVDGNEQATAVERVLLDQLLDDLVWRLNEMP